jgi:hypothetical protein
MLAECIFFGQNFYIRVCFLKNTEPDKVKYVLVKMCIFSGLKDCNIHTFLTFVLDGNDKCSATDDLSLEKEVTSNN